MLEQETRVWERTYGWYFKPQPGRDHAGSEERSWREEDAELNPGDLPTVRSEGCSGDRNREGV